MRKRVVVVEDDEFIGEVIATSLAREGYSVDLFRSGSKMWEYLRHTRPHLIFLDLGLPDEDGITICRKLRNIPTMAKVPIVVVSAWSQPCEINAAMAAGADDFIGKPFDLDDLITAAKQYTSRRATQTKHRTMLRPMTPN